MSKERGLDRRVSRPTPDSEPVEECRRLVEEGGIRSNRTVFYQTVDLSEDDPKSTKNGPGLDPLTPLSDSWTEGRTGVL